MAKQTINIGSAPNDGTGDTARDAFDICNDNFTELYTGSAIAEGAAILSTGPVTDGYVLTADGAGGAAWEAAASGTPEGTAILSTGEVGGSKFLREDGDGTSSWQAIPAPEGTSVLSTGPVTDGYVLTADGAGGAAWEAAAGGGGTPGGSSGDIQYNNAGSFDGSYLKQGTNTIEQYNSTNAQSFLLFNTRTDASNYERGFMKWNSNVLEIGTEAAGTGTNRALKLIGGVDSDNYLTVGEASNQTLYAYHAGSKWLIFEDDDFRLSSASRFRFSGSTSPAGGIDAEISRSGSGVIGFTDAIRIGQSSGYTVATLPTASVGMIARVTDASSPTIGNAVSGGGAAFALVCYNGSQWTVCCT